MPRKVFETAASDFLQTIDLLIRRVRTAGESHEFSLTESAEVARRTHEAAAGVIIKRLMEK